MKGYKQLTREQRYQIEALKKEGFLNKAIARNLSVSASTISREFRRNTGQRGYCPKQAHQKSEERKLQAVKAIKMTAAVRQLIEEKLRFDCSPEQISAVLKRENNISISHETIYQHVWRDRKHGGDLYLHLRQAYKKRRKKYASKDKRGQLKNRVSIEERPLEVEDKARIGDFEIDTVIGKNHQGALVTIVDRKSKFTLIKKVERKHAEGVTTALIELLEPYKGSIHTITADNGKEFAGHETVASVLETNVYFAHPYCSWERGLNENTNGLIRQYFPKGTTFENITKADIANVMHRLNNRPRKTLNYRTPQAVFFDEFNRKAV